MNKRVAGLFSMTSWLALIAMLVASGCGRSVVSECKRLCSASCEANEDCTVAVTFDCEGRCRWNILGTDREGCLKICDDDCEMVEGDILNHCEDGVAIDGDLADRCVDGLERLGQACRDHDESEREEATWDLSTECRWSPPQISGTSLGVVFFDQFHECL